MIKPDIYNKLIKSRNQKDILIPTYNGQQGNPVLFNKSMKEKILSTKGDSGAKKILELYKDKALNLEINNQIVDDFFKIPREEDL